MNLEINGITMLRLQKDFHLELDGGENFAFKNRIYIHFHWIVFIFMSNL